MRPRLPRAGASVSAMLAMAGVGTLCTAIGLEVPSPARAAAPIVVAQADEAPEPAKPKVRRPAKPKKADHAEKKFTPPPAPVPATLAGAAAAGAAAAPLDVAAALKRAGAGTCADTIDVNAIPSMVGVTQSNTVSTWSDVDPRDKHAVSVFIGQRYGGSQTVPFGVTGLVASPNPSGSCDSTVVQVVSSPLPCGNVRDTLARGGRFAGDLAGIALMQSPQGQTLLMPTANNTCVLIGFHSKFGR